LKYIKSCESDNLAYSDHTAEEQPQHSLYDRFHIFKLASGSRDIQILSIIEIVSKND